MNTRVIIRLLILSACIAHSLYAYDIKSLNTSEVEEYMKKGYVLVNVLPEEEFKNCHIPGSENLSIVGDEATFKAQAKERYAGKEQNIIFHCAGTYCPASHKATMLLIWENFLATSMKGEKAPFGKQETPEKERIVYYAGGIIGWRKDGKETIGDCDKKYLHESHESK